MTDTADTTERALTAADATAIAEALARVPSLLRQLDITITRTDAMAPERVGSSGHKVPVVPYNQQASDARVHLEKVLRRHTGMISGYLGVTPLHRGPRGHAQFLAEHIASMVGLPGTYLVRQEIVGACRRGWGAVDRRPDRAYVGACPRCGGELYATRTAAEVKCAAEGCSAKVQVAAQRAGMLALARESAGTAAELARTLPGLCGEPVKAGTIRQWAARGRLQGREQGGRVVYRVGDVLDLLASQAAGRSLSA